MNLNLEKSKFVEEKAELYRSHGLEPPEDDPDDRMIYASEVESLVFQNYFMPQNLFDKYENEKKHLKQCHKCP